MSKQYYTVDIIPRNTPKRHRCVGYVLASDLEQAFREADRFFPHNGMEVLNVRLSKNQEAAQCHYTRQIGECAKWELWMRQPAIEINR